jgi:hypothetical protein
VRNPRLAEKMLRMSPAVNKALIAPRYAIVSCCVVMTMVVLISEAWGDESSLKRYVLNQSKGKQC